MVEQADVWRNERCSSKRYVDHRLLAFVLGSFAVSYSLKLFI